MSKAEKASTAKDRPGVDRPIRINDIEDGLRSLKSDINTVKESATGAGVAAGLALAVLLVILAFAIGRSRGKKKFAFVEIRRA